jgi:hypothetical protein
MLLRESLADKDIPRRDKVREAILDQFEKQFKALKTELSVRDKINSIKKYANTTYRGRTPPDALV